MSESREMRPRRVGLRGRVASCLFATLVQVLAPAAWAQDSLPEPLPDSLPDSTQFAPDSGLEILPAPERPIRVGESLRFSVQYGFIKAGSAWLEVPEVVDWNGRPSWRLVARAESNGFFDKMYKVRNRIESVWDQQERFSWRYFEDRHEGGFTANDTLTFFPDSAQVRYKDGRTYPIPPSVQDALSAFYFTRFQPLPLGGSVTFDYHASRRSLPLEVKILGRQRIKTPAGRFNCIVIEPMLKAGGIFKNKGRLVIWLTDDDRRIPVQMRSKVLIGSISVTLQEARMGT